MKSKKKFNLFSRTVIFLTALILIIALTAIGLFYYIFSIPEPEGLSLAKWPQDFANSFSVWTAYENGNLTVEDIGLKRLDEYGLWIQFIDESGEEIFSHNKPVHYPTKYTASELMKLSANEYENGYTAFVSCLDDSDEVCSYIIGFPYDIGKHTIHFNRERVARLSPAMRFIIIASFGILSASILGYSFWLSRKLSKVTKGINRISHRTYTRLKENGIFREVYKELNKMDSDIRHADKVNEDTERVRREWIANITHDLKTPLSPIKGYAELLADRADLTSETSKEYGEIILRNVNHTEKLINDLKMTYQLDAGAFVYNPKEIQLTRFLKELVIDIVNDPAFSIVILSTHIVSDVSYIADTILMMKQGQFILQEPMITVTDHIKGKVWELFVDERKAGEYSKHFSVVNLHHENNMVRLRIVNETAPSADAYTVEPRLEDLFLYHFGEGSQVQEEKKYVG